MFFPGGGGGGEARGAVVPPCSIAVVLCSIAIICIERSYANRILQVSMDRIIDVFEKRKNRESFMQSVHVLIILLYIRLRRLIQ